MNICSYTHRLVDTSKSSRSFSSQQMETTTENHKINAGLLSPGTTNISNKTHFNLRPWEPILNGPGVLSKPEVKGICSEMCLLVISESKPIISLQHDSQTWTEHWLEQMRRRSAWRKTLDALTLNKRTIGN